jgi:CubicO group peptidase (beta-lactamase class C family)
LSGNWCAGKPLAEFFRDEVAGPLGVEFYLGLPAGLEGRVAPTIRPSLPRRSAAVSHFAARARQDPASVQALVGTNTGRFGRPREVDSPDSYRAVLPSQGGISHARGLAGLYAPLALGGAAGGVLLVDKSAVDRLAAYPSALVSDAVLLIGVRFALGFWKSSDNRGGPPGARDSLLLGGAAFGHPGMGGSVGFADPEARLAFGYVMNKQGPGVALNDRGQSLIDAAYRALGR